MVTRIVFLCWHILIWFSINGDGRAGILGDGRLLVVWVASTDVGKKKSE